MGFKMTEKDLELERIIRQANFTWERGEVALDEKGNRIKTREEYIATAVMKWHKSEQVKLLENVKKDFYSEMTADQFVSKIRQEINIRKEKG